MNVLCIGIDNYIIGAKPLHNCVAEATTVFQALRETTQGHHQLLLDPTSASLHQAVKTFSERSRAFPRNLLFFAGHGYEFEGQVYVKSPDSDTASADVCVGGIRANMADGSLFICLLNCCKIHIAQAIEAPRMILMKPAPLPSVREFLRSLHRLRRPVQKEHFYLSSVLVGEAAIDDPHFGNHFAEIIRTSPQSSIEKVARLLKSGGTHVEWRSNLEYWHETPIGNIVSFSPKFRVKHLYLFFGLASLSLTICGMLLTTQVNGISTYREVSVVQSHSLFCEGPYFDTRTVDLSKAEEDLKPRQDDLARVCLAQLFRMQNRMTDSLKLARSICASSTEPLPQAVACGFVCEIRCGIENCFEHQIQVEEIACSAAGHVCNRARLRLAMSRNIKTWADMQSGQKTSWDPEVKQTLISLNRSTVNEHVRLGALMELANIEHAAGDLSIARQMLLDLIPRTAGPLPHLQLPFAWKVCVDYMETLLRMESLHAAMHWFHQALQIPQDDLRRSKVFLVMAGGLLKLKMVDEAMEKLTFGIQLILHTNAEWRPPSCYDHLTSTAGSTTRINSTCLHEVLVRGPFLFDREEASLLAEAPAFHSFYLTSSGMGSKPSLS